MYYITMNPKTPKVHQKLIKTCKHFFIKNPILVVFELCFDDENGWHAMFNGQYISGEEHRRIVFKNVLNEATLLNDDDSIVPLEKVIEVLPNAKSFHYVFDVETVMEVVTPDTVKKLVKIPHFSKLNRFTLELIPENFDIQTFYEYIKGNKKTKICLLFDNEYSDDYLVLLQTIVYEIHATENRDYEFPHINMRTMEDED
uniref:Uncharacterized protein n=1 Tax=Panagrolaimus davidi TaxID=227884 RepID=A0A914PK92_9BILA